MKINNLKGVLLEYLMLQLLQNCGFRTVTSDGIYVCDLKGSQYVTGRGGFHDADVLVEPPLQFPFMFPQRLIFEGKALKKVGLQVVRGLRGVREDVNQFELLTSQLIEDRKRGKYDIQSRNCQRYQYQTGVIVLNDFTGPAVEFARHHKIPLFALSWFETLYNSFNENNAISLLDLFGNLCDEGGSASAVSGLTKLVRSARYSAIDDMIRIIENEYTDVGVSTIKVLKKFKLIITRFSIAVATTGEMLLLYNHEHAYQLEQNKFHEGDMEIYYRDNIRQINNGNIALYSFLLPKEIQKQFDASGRSQDSAKGLKSAFLGKITVYINGGIHIYNIDKDRMRKTFGR